jgi:uncharacterized metal-binding protein
MNRLDSKPLVYPCSGGSGAEQLADAAALMRPPLGEGACP